MKLIITRKQALTLLKNLPNGSSISMIGTDALKIIQEIEPKKK